MEETEMVKNGDDDGGNVSKDLELRSRTRGLCSNSFLNDLH